MAHGGRTALNTQQLKLGLWSSDVAGPTLVKKRGQVVKTVATNENIDAVYDMVMSVRRVTLLQIVDTLGLSYGTVNRSLYIELEVTKSAA